MKTRFAIIAFIVSTLLFSSCNSMPDKYDKEETINTDSLSIVANGEHLVTIAGCHDCHSPKRLGPNGPEIIPESMLSGYAANRPLPAFDTALAKKGIIQINEDMTAAAGPWGISFASNLTPDATGVGSWPFENFKTALRHGKAKGIQSGRSLLPPMPWFNYKAMTDEELKAIHAYLKTVKPVKNIAPDPILFAPLKQ